MKNWLAEIVSVGVGGLWVLGQALPETPFRELEWVKVLGPGAVGLVALYLSFRYAKDKDEQVMAFLTKQNEENRHTIHKLTLAIEEQNKAIITCPARLGVGKK